MGLIKNIRNFTLYIAIPASGMLITNKAVTNKVTNNVLKNSIGMYTKQAELLKDSVVNTIKLDTYSLNDFGKGLYSKETFLSEIDSIAGTKSPKEKVFYFLDLLNFAQKNKSIKKFNGALKHVSQVMDYERFNTKLWWGERQWHKLTGTAPSMPKPYNDTSYAKQVKKDFVDVINTKVDVNKEGDVCQVEILRRK